MSSAALRASKRVRVISRRIMGLLCPPKTLYPSATADAESEEVNQYVSIGQINVVRKFMALAPGGRMVSTGHGARRTTRSATLPRTR
jgi:hypothetical protein